MSDSILDILKPKPSQDQFSQAREHFKEKTGRDLTPQEESLVFGTKGDPIYNAGAFANGLQSLSNQILTRAKAGGLTLTPEQASQIRDQFYTGGDQRSADTFNDNIGSYLNTLQTQQFQKQQKDTIDRAQNPQLYITDQEKSANQQTAQSLISQVYGADQVQDPHLVDFISQQIAQGIHPYELSQFLQTTPQYLQKQAETENQRVQQESLNARNALDQQLQQSQQEVFNRAAPNIIASYMRAGRLNSSGLNSALANAQADLERERQGFLGNAGYNDAIRAQGYNRENFVNNQATAFNNYLRQSQPSYQQRSAVQDASNYANFQQPYNNLARQYQLNDQATQRQYQLEDYNRQQNDYFRALDQQRQSQRANLPYQLAGSLLGAGLQGWASGGFKIA